jgi:hypothetical protein
MGKLFDNRIVGDNHSRKRQMGTFAVLSPAKTPPPQSMHAQMIRPKLHVPSAEPVTRLTTAISLPAK